MSHDRTPNSSNRPTLPGLRELFPDLPRSAYNSPDVRPRTIPLPTYLPPHEVMHPHRAPAYPQHARRPSNPTNAPMPIPQYLAAQSPRPAIQSQSPGTPSPATPGSSSSSSASSTGHLYQVLAIGPNGLNAVQTETARPIGIYRQDKRRHEAHAPASASADGEPRRFVCQDCGAAFLRPSELRTHQHRHTGQKAYVCSRCGKDFSTSSNLARHLRSLHPDGLAERRRSSNASAGSSASSTSTPEA